MLYSKNGSIPKPQTDGTDGWIEVPDEPVAPEGQEVVWVYPPGWVVRNVMPPVREGYRWVHYLDRGWVEMPLPGTVVEVAPVLESAQVDALTSAQIEGLTSAQIDALTTSQISGL